MAKGTGSEPRHHSRSYSCRSCVARRRLAWGIHVGRARSSARGAVAWNRWHFRRVGGRDECRSLVDGHAKGGAAVARTALENFWRRVSEAARFSPLRRAPLDVILGRWTLNSSPLYVAMDIMSRLLSPYDLNPMGNNPLRAIWPKQSISSGWREHLRSSSSPLPMFGPDVVTCSRTTLLRRTFCSPRPVCPPCSRL